MNANLLLPNVLEFLLISIALGRFFQKNFLNSNPRIFILWIFFLALSLMLISVYLGGNDVAIMGVKVIFFMLAIGFAMMEPRAARWWLLASIVISLLVQASAGNVLNKYSTLPFLLMACLWATARANFGMREIIVVVFFLAAEFVQALVLESRGLLLSAVMACGFLVVPLNVARRTVIISAVLLPIFYPVALASIFATFISGSNIVDATSSNFERSAMAAWCINNLSFYSLVGPGSLLFTEEINAIKILGEQAVADNYDPHQFLLSAWIWLGTYTVLVLYIIWCLIWIFKGRDWVVTVDRRIKLFAIIAITAILTFVLSPPDTTTRVQVAMLVGISVAGLRDPSILMRKPKVSVSLKTVNSIAVVEA
jgi:hypothetical protein